MNEPLVSITFPTFNRASLIGATLDSLLSQTYPHLEIVIVDDGSTDDSARVIRDYQSRFPEKIRAIFQPNQGPSVATSKAIQLSRGEYIALSSDDDLSMPTRIEHSLRYLKQHPPAGIVCTHVEYIDQNSQVLTLPPAAFANVFNHPQRTPAEMALHFVRKGNYLCSPSVLMRREVFSEYGPHHPASFQLSDFEFFIRAMRTYEIHILPKKELAYRVHTNRSNLSHEANSTKVANEYSLLGRNLLLTANQLFNQKLFTAELNRHGVAARPHWPSEFYVFRLAMLPDVVHLYPSAVEFIGDYLKAHPDRSDLIREFNEVCGEADAFNIRHCQLLAQTLGSTLNSKSYRVGRKILSPGRLIKNFLAKNKTAE